MILPILKYGASVLKSPVNTVDFFNSELEKIARNMIETMYAASGAGLAANQVGIDINITTIDVSGGRDAADLITLCNPEIIASEGEQKKEEGCLSIPEFSEVVTRPLKIVVRGQDIHGDEIRIEAQDMLARCLSHEIDHLKGIMFIDHLSALKRSLIKNRIKRLIKAGKW
jgi:peptide deformylase